MLGFHCQPGSRARHVSSLRLCISYSCTSQQLVMLGAICLHIVDLSKLHMPHNCMGQIAACRWALTSFEYVPCRDLATPRMSDIVSIASLSSLTQRSDFIQPFSLFIL